MDGRNLVELQDGGSALDSLANQLAILATLDDDQDDNGDNDALKIDEKAHALDQGAVLEATLQEPLDQPTYQAEPDVLDTFFAVAEIFEELEVMHMRNRNAWTQHYSGGLDLLTASLVTTTALNMVRVMEAQLIEQNPSLADPLDVVTLFLRWIYFARGQAAEFDRLFAKYEIDPADHDANGHVFLWTFFRLRALPGALNGGPPTYDPDLNAKVLTPAQQFANDVELLKVMATNGMQYAQLADVKRFLHVDVFLEELQQYLATQKLTYTLLVATLFLLEVHKMSGKAVVSGRKTLHFTMRAMYGTVIRFFGNWYHRVQYRNEKDLPASIRTLHGMLKTLSIDTLVAPDAHWDNLINVAHLYEACRQYGGKNGIDVSWPDLEDFMTLYDKKSQAPIEVSAPMLDGPRHAH
ncbi:hypothetical protein GGF32_002930 [Allomyces javanicus]|nr:hypothetical protein GGF32_002930 [Allomyces javanicus]